MELRLYTALHRLNCIERLIRLGIRSKCIIQALLGASIQDKMQFQESGPRKRRHPAKNGIFMSARPFRVIRDFTAVYGTLKFSDSVPTTVFQSSPRVGEGKTRGGGDPCPASGPGGRRGVR